MNLNWNSRAQFDLRANFTTAITDQFTNDFNDYFTPKFNIKHFIVGREFVHAT